MQRLYEIVQNLKNEVARLKYYVENDLQVIENEVSAMQREISQMRLDLDDLMEHKETIDKRMEDICQEIPRSVLSRRTSSLSNLEVPVDAYDAVPSHYLHSISALTEA